MDAKKLSNELYNGFVANPSILYVGLGIENDQLTTLASCPWSCILTSREDLEFLGFFTNEDRKTRSVYSKTDIEGKPFNRKVLPVIWLFGKSDELEQSEDDFFQTETKYDRAKDILKFFFNCMTPGMSLHIVGIDTKEDKEIFREIGGILRKDVHDGSVFFWGMPEPETMAIEKHKYFSSLKKLSEEKRFHYYPLPLNNVIEAHDVRWDENDKLQDVYIMKPGDDTYYQAHKTIHLSQEDALLFRSIGARLLSEGAINTPYPVGKIEYNRWFFNFLDRDTAKEPIWCGYLRRSRFYVKRSFENTLAYVVRKLLEGKNIVDDSASNREGKKNKSIMLAGDPGSSKSITLGALAYRVFNERNNPVVYIYGENFSGNDADVNRLDDALRFIESQTEGDTRILVVWDNATYSNNMESARKLCEQLDGRGRRVLLVCAGYNNSVYELDNNNTKLFRYAEKKSASKEQSEENNVEASLIPCGKDCWHVAEYGDWFVIKAERDMNDDEINAFFNLIREYSGIDNAQIQDFEETMKAEGARDIFSYFYFLIFLLREKLEGSLNREMTIVSPYVETKVNQTLYKIAKQRNDRMELLPFAKELKRLGYSFDPGLLPENEEEKKVEVQLDEFNLCVAMFTQFRLKVSYFLGCRLLLGSRLQEHNEEIWPSSAFVNSYSIQDSTMNDYSMFSQVTSQIPWLVCDNSEEGDLSFRFRNPLEAGIFLKNNDPEGNRQIEILYKLMDILGQDYKDTNAIDTTFAKNLQELLHYVGPNSKYPGYTQRYGDEFLYHKKVLDKLDQIIEKLIALVDDYQIPDLDGEFTSIIVTFIREFYGNLWSEKIQLQSIGNHSYIPNQYVSKELFEFRIEKMINAISRAGNCIDRLDCAILAESNYQYRQHLQSQKYILITENAQCNIQLNKLKDDYFQFCEDSGQTPNEKAQNFKLNYHTLSESMLRVIYSNPIDGYGYNTLFKLLESEYDKQVSQEDKLRSLESIYPILDLCELHKNEIINRGANDTDEMERHISKIRDYSGKISITIKDILRHKQNGTTKAEEQNNPFFSLYDTHLKTHQAASIEFLCRKEFQAVNKKDRLSDREISICQSIHDFMLDPENYACVSNSRTAMELLIRVTWILYNRRFLNATEELQSTYLNYNQWKEIHGFCAQYDRISDEFRQPVFILLYALSAIQINNRSEDSYQLALNILHTLKENKFYQRRMRTPFMICDEHGIPYKYRTGIVIDVQDRTGHIKVSGIPKYLDGKPGVRFHNSNLGRNHAMPQMNETLVDLEIGIGYVSYQVYTANGREERRNNRG